MFEMSLEPSEVTAVILCGGLGTRLRGAIGEVPKPMAQVRGRPFVEWIIEGLRREGIRRVILSAGYRAEVISGHFQEARFDGMEIRVVAEPEPLGTAGGFRHAVETAGVPASHWLVLNGDSLVAARLHPLLNLRNASGFFAALLGVWMDDASRYGSLSIDEKSGRLIRFQEKRPGAAWINSGIYLFSQAAARTLSRRGPLSWEHDIFPGWLAAGRNIRVVQTHASFLDIGIPEDFALAEKFLVQAAAALEIQFPDG